MTEGRVPCAAADLIVAVQQGKVNRARENGTHRRGQRGRNLAHTGGEKKVSACSHLIYNLTIDNSRGWWYIIVSTRG